MPHAALSPLAKVCTVPWPSPTGNGGLLSSLPPPHDTSTAAPNTQARRRRVRTNAFMDAMLAAARDAGWPEERLHREYFSATPVDTSGDGSFEVQIASTGAVIRVEPNRSVVAALAAAGIEVPTSCEQGVCGTCLTRVLEGTPDHRDMYLTPQEQARGDQFTPCCSRAKSARLVLDL